MKVKELIKYLKQKDQEKEIYLVDCSGYSDFYLYMIVEDKDGIEFNMDLYRTQIKEKR